MRNIFWTVFDIFFLAAVFYLPFGIALNIAPDFDLASVRILILALFLVWLAGNIFQGFNISRFQYFDARASGLFVILVFGVLSLVSAQEPAWGLRKLLVFLSIFPFYFVTTGFLRGSQSRPERLLKVIFASAAASAAIAFVQFFSQLFFEPGAVLGLYTKYIGPVFWGQSFSALVAENPSWLVEVGGKTILRAFGLFPDPHMMAVFLGLVSPLVLAAFLHTKKRSLFAIFCLMLVVLMLTFSRGGYLGIFFSVFTVLALAWRSLEQKQKRLVLSAVVLGVFFVMVFAGPVVNRFISSFLFNEGSSLSRLSIWAGSWQIFLQNPLLGVGLGNYPRAVEPLSVYRSPITSHNLYLDILSETGIFGLAAWAFLLFGSGWQLIRRIKRDQGNRGNKENLGELGVLRIGLFGSLVYFFVHSVFETAIFNPAILAILMIILALISVTNKDLTHPSPLFKKERGLI